MALRVIRAVIPTGAAALKSANITQTAGVHTSSRKSLGYGFLAYMLGERTTPRFNQNSKIITVDGNLASGKGALAQKLADQLGMLYMPEADIFYLDKRSGSERLPVDFNGMCSLEKFYTDPKAADGNSYRLQLWMYNMRIVQYADAIEHLITTGQGVVLERSPFSDMVFLEAMLEEGYIRRQCAEHYNEIKHISICEFLPPHLVIYIDQPAEEVQKKLKQSDKPYLHNVPLSYLKAIGSSYKNLFLPEIMKKSEVLVFDVAHAEQVQVVLDDIKYLKFDKGPWLEQDDVTLHHMRVFVEDKYKVGTLTHIPKFLPEITISSYKYDDMYHAYKALHGKMYAPGYNSDSGDKYIWLK
ncbi:NADH dehydrogenase [ubiquinone] 1 alpha subcomplex subunit 10, mitochondrial [Antennarius striatus]|uniref:NADH dehydrogenase [ubiquinone] 1 alpha subcomplex subunit 10, mitochondrial n=1 Tax=Antennarius striatus TaxID=241820 RepID=UPI0035AE6338